MLKDMAIASRLGLEHHLELAVTTAVRDRLLEQEQRGYAEEDFSVIVRKYFAEAPLPSVEQDLELFEKPPPIEPAATISSMGEVAAAVQQDVDLPTPPIEAPPQTDPEQSVAAEVAPPKRTEETAPATQNPAELAPPPPPAEEQAPPSSPMDMLAKLLRGESARPDGS